MGIRGEQDKSGSGVRTGVLGASADGRNLDAEILFHAHKV